MLREARRPAEEVNGAKMPRTGRKYTFDNDIAASQYIASCEEGGTPRSMRPGQMLRAGVRARQCDRIRVALHSCPACCNLGRSPAHEHRERTQSRESPARDTGQSRREWIADNDADFVTPGDMLPDLREDNLALAQRMRETHEVCDEHGDVATASLLENWIDQACSKPAGADRRSGLIRTSTVRAPLPAMLPV